MTYTRDHGKLALRYLATWSKNRLPHHEKAKKGASFFLENFHGYLQNGRECHRCGCEPHLAYFSIMLAYRVYDGLTSEPDDLFLWMCYIYMLYILRQSEFSISEDGYRKLKKEASELSIREIDMLVLFQELANDLWELRTEKLVGARPQIRLAS